VWFSEPPNKELDRKARMARWLVEINGDAFDVDEFPYWFPAGEAHAVAENGKVFLVGGALDVLAEASDVHDVAVQLVDEYFAIIGLLQPGLRRPSVGVVFREDDDGTRKGFAFLSGVAAGRSKAHPTLTVATVAGEQKRATRPTQAQELLAATRSDRRLQVALSLIAIPGATWPHLYRCLEELEYYLGMKVGAAGLCSSNQRERFTRTANSAEVSGRDSRHRIGKFEPPTDPMSISEARAFVSQVLQATLRNVAKAENAA